jgi:hypothetical protein
MAGRRSLVRKDLRWHAEEFVTEVNGSERKVIDTLGLAKKTN